MATTDRPSGPARTRPTQANSSPRQPVSAVATPPPRPSPRENWPEKPSYLKYAFANPYNLTLLGGSLAAAALTFSPFIALAGLGLEAIWLVNSDSAPLRRFLWDPLIERERREARAAERLARLQSLADPDRKRVEDLLDRQAEIHRLAAQNPSLTGDLLRTELTKTDRLVDSFIDMAVTSARYDEYLRSVDVPSLDVERSRLERDIKFAKEGDGGTDLAKKNLAIILKRLEKMKEIRRYLDVARGQLDLIENSFQLIADQIVTMQSPQELSGQLNELLDGVESIRQTAIETDEMLEA